MKLFKPNNSYAKSNFSEYEYKDHASQYNLSNYNNQAPEYLLGQSIGECDANQFSQAKTKKSTTFYANTQQAHPSPAIHVQQGHHNYGMEKMTRNESHMGQEWAGNSPNYASPALLDDSSHMMHNEKHMMGKMGQSWDKKSNQFSSRAQNHNYAQSMYKGRDEEAFVYCEDGIDGGYANKATMLSSPNHLSPIKTNQSSFSAHNNEHKMGMMDNNWANSISNYSSPTQAHNSGMKMNNNWANSPTKFSSSNQAQQSHFPMQRKEHMMENKEHDLGYLATTQAHWSDMGYNAMHKEGHMTGEVDHGWSNSSPKFPSSNHSSSNSNQAHHSNMSMHKGGHTMGEMDNSWGSSPTKFSTPYQANHTGLTMGKEEHMMGKSNYGWANSPTHYSGPNQSRSLNNTMHREHNQHEWGGNSSNHYGANHVTSHSGHVSYDDCDQYADEDVNDIMDEILTKYPAHNVSGGHNGGSWGTNHNSCASQNLATGYAKQQGFGGSANYRGDAQALSSASSNFAANKHMNAGYSSSFKKEEYSSSSSEKKFETRGMMNNGGYYDDII